MDVKDVPRKRKHFELKDELVVDLEWFRLISMKSKVSDPAK